MRTPAKIRPYLVSISLVAISVISLDISLTSVQARPSSLDVNVREQCRQIIAGTYLANHDQYQKVLQQLEMLTLKESGMKKELEKTQKELVNILAQEAKESFQVEIAAKKDRLLQISQSYQQRVTEYANMIETAEQNRTKFSAQRSQFEKQIQTVFLVENLKQKEPAGYPFQVKYRHSCSKYRKLCPLPHKMSEELVKIRVEGKNPDACTRYASYSNLH